MGFDGVEVTYLVKVCLAFSEPHKHTRMIRKDKVVEPSFDIQPDFSGERVKEQTLSFYFILQS